MSGCRSCGKGLYLRRSGWRQECNQGAPDETNPHVCQPTAGRCSELVTGFDVFLDIFFIKGERGNKEVLGVGFKGLQLPVNHTPRLQRGNAPFQTTQATL